MVYGHYASAHHSTVSLNRRRLLPPKHRLMPRQLQL
jgi:hypothetical protein